MCDSSLDRDLGDGFKSLLSPCLAVSLFSTLNCVSLKGVCNLYTKFRCELQVYLRISLFSWLKSEDPLSLVSLMRTGKYLCLCRKSRMTFYLKESVWQDWRASYPWRACQSQIPESHPRLTKSPFQHASKVIVSDMAKLSVIRNHSSESWSSLTRTSRAFWGA